MTLTHKRDMPDKRHERKYVGARIRSRLSTLFSEPLTVSMRSSATAVAVWVAVRVAVFWRTQKTCQTNVMHEFEHVSPRRHSLISDKAWWNHAHEQALPSHATLTLSPGNAIASFINLVSRASHCAHGMKNNSAVAVWVAVLCIVLQRVFKSCLRVIMRCRACCRRQGARETGAGPRISPQVSSILIPCSKMHTVVTSLFTASIDSSASHITYEWVMSRLNGSCHTRESHPNGSCHTSCHSCHTPTPSTRYDNSSLLC